MSSIISLTIVLLFTFRLLLLTSPSTSFMGIGGALLRVQHKLQKKIKIHPTEVEQSYPTKMHQANLDSHLNHLQDLVEHLEIALGQLSMDLILLQEFMQQKNVWLCFKSLFHPFILILYNSFQQSFFVIKLYLLFIILFVSLLFYFLFF